MLIIIRCYKSLQDAMFFLLHQRKEISQAEQSMRVANYESVIPIGQDQWSDRIIANRG